MKNNCNITKDLLPLYIEDLCSEDSREYVDEHLEECSECMKTFQYLKYTDLCVNATEKREINGFKKLERYISGKILINYFLFLVAIVLGILILIFTTNRVEEIIYYFLMPLTMLATGITFYHISPKASGIIRLTKRLVIQIILLFFNIFMIFYMMHSLRLNRYPFGMQPYETGPFLTTQFKITIGLSLFFLISHLYHVAGRGRPYNPWCNLSILCIFLCLTYDATLYHMDDWETYCDALLEYTIILFLIAFCFILLMWGVIRHHSKKQEPAPQDAQKITE